MAGMTKTQTIQLRMDPELVARIDAAAGSRGRTRWISEAALFVLEGSDPEVANPDLSRDESPETPREAAPVNLSHPPTAKKTHPKSAPRPQSPGKVFNGPIPKVGKK